MHPSFLAINFAILGACTSASHTVLRADYADGDPRSFSREARSYAPAEGVYVYDLVADGDQLVALADWTDTDREPPSVEGLLRLDPATGVLDDVRTALELGSPSGGGLLARTDGALVAVIDSPVAGLYAAPFTLDGGVSAHVSIPMDHAFAAAVSGGLLFVAGLDRGACAGRTESCPRIWTWDLETRVAADLTWPDVADALALQPVEGGVEMLSEDAFARYDRASDSWETRALPEPVSGFTALSDTERLFFRWEDRLDSQPVVLDLESGAWHLGNFDDGSHAPVRLSAVVDGQTWVLDGWAAEEGFVPTLSVLHEG